MPSIESVPVSAVVPYVLSAAVAGCHQIGSVKIGDLGSYGECVGVEIGCRRFENHGAARRVACHSGRTGKHGSRNGNGNDHSLERFKVVGLDNRLIAAYQLEDAVKSEGAADASADASQPAALAEELDTSAPCPFAGEYDVLNVNGDGEEFYFEEFIIEEDWSVHGAVEASGLTGFEGTVDGFGVISAEFKRLGGTMSGTVDLEGNVAGISEVRGRTSTFNGVIY